MIRAQDITIVMQGDIRPETMAAIQAVRRVLPGARLILSTFVREPVEPYRGLVDALVLSEDPGAQAPYTVSRFAAPNNLNRQLVSTQAGLLEVATPYTLKLRTDCVLASSAFVHRYEAVKQADPGGDRLVANTFYTRHPRGISSYLFHVSDWFIFGSTPTVSQFWAVTPMSDEEATWFECHPHLPGSTLAARRFRARFTPEQHIATEFGRKRGYQVPHFLNDRSGDLVTEYTRCLAREFIIDSPEGLGFGLPKYAHLAESLYQTLDCVNYDDWRTMFSRWVPATASIPARHTLWERSVQRVLRDLAHRFRRPLIRAVQGWRGLKLTWARKRVSGAAPLQPN